MCMDMWTDRVCKHCYRHETVAIESRSRVHVRAYAHKRERPDHTHRRTCTAGHGANTDGHAHTDADGHAQKDVYRRAQPRVRASAFMCVAWRGVHELARAARVREEGAHTRAWTRARTVCIPGCWVVCTPSAGTNRVWSHDIVRKCLCTFPFTCLAILNRPAHVCTSIYACVERPSQVQRVRDTQQEPDWGDQASDRVTKVPTQGVEARLNVHAADRPQMLHATDSAGAADVRRTDLLPFKVTWFAAVEINQRAH